MFVSRSISLLVVFALIYSSVAGQLPAVKSNPEKVVSELEKQALELLEQIVVETAALKLPENRALIYATTGDLLWPRDEKRARALFRAAAGEIVEATNVKIEPPNSPRLNEPFYARSEIYNLRQTVLRMLAERDAEMALELLQATRPAAVAAEMQTYVMPQPGAPRNPASPPQVRNIQIEQEIRLEQSLIVKAAGQDPQKAAQRIRESLEKGFPPEIVSSLNRLYQKDAELATKLMGELVQKLLAADWSKTDANLSFAVNLIRPYALTTGNNPTTNPPRIPAFRPQPPLDEKSIRDIALKIADTLLKTTDYRRVSAFNYALPVLEKILPERIAQLKQKQAALKKQTPARPQNANSNQIYQPPAAYNDPNAPPESLIAAAPKAPAQFRGMLYREAAVRGLRADPEKTRALLLGQPESAERDDAIRYLDAALVMRQIQSGKLDEARRLIDRLPSGAAKAEQIVQMALAIYRMNASEKDTALGLMEEARQMIREFPEDREETEALLKVVAGFAVIEPERAFPMLAPVIEQANEVTNAQAVLARYNKQTQAFRDGELVMASNSGAFSARFSRYGRELKLLAQSDFPRTLGLIEQFRRDDVRIFVKLFIAQSILK